MPLGAWGLLAGPLAAAQLAAANDPEAAKIVPALEALAAAEQAIGESLSGTDLEAQSADLFVGALALDDSVMGAASGGEDTAIDIGSLGVNISDQSGGVSSINTTNSPTGAIGGNIVSDNGGITTVFNNTGNGVIFQSTVNVNIFTAPSQ
jgi:hypothetical protein